MLVAINIRRNEKNTVVTILNNGKTVLVYMYHNKMNLGTCIRQFSSEK